MPHCLRLSYILSLLTTVPAGLSDCALRTPTFEMIRHFRAHKGLAWADIHTEAPGFLRNELGRYLASILDAKTARLIDDLPPDQNFLIPNSLPHKLERATVIRGPEEPVRGARISP